eukprot:scaffold107811_cov66-Phaeocystis_antarctica.AAC.2
MAGPTSRAGNTWWYLYLPIGRAYCRMGTRTRTRQRRCSAGHEPAHSNQSVQGGARLELKEQRQAHLPPSLILVHVGVSQRCRGPPAAVGADVESPATLPTMSTRNAGRNVPAGRCVRTQGRFNRRAHNVSLILVHIGVGQRCRAAIDVESPASLCQP